MVKAKKLYSLTASYTWKYTKNILCELLVICKYLSGSINSYEYEDVIKLIFLYYGIELRPFLTKHSLKILPLLRHDFNMKLREHL